VLLHVGFHAVVVRNELTVQRMVGCDTVFYRIVAAGINVVEVRVTLTDDGFPNKRLCCHNVCQLICIGGILRTPFGCYRSGVAVLEDSTDEQFDLICFDGLVIGRGIVVPIGFITLGHHVADGERCTRFDTVTGIAVPRADGVNRDFLGLACEPAVHIVEFAMPPIGAVVIVAFTGECHHYHLIGFGFSCKSSCRSHPDKSGKAHHYGKQCRHTFPE